MRRIRIGAIAEQKMELAGERVDSVLLGDMVLPEYNKVTFHHPDKARY